MKSLPKDKKIDEIRQKVSESKGQLSLCVRGFKPKKQEDHYNPVISVYHLETGVINGNLLENEKPNCKFIPINDFSFTLDKRDYIYMCKLEIPVREKLVKSSLFDPSFNFDYKDLKNRERNGKISFSSLESLKKLDFLKFSYLENINVCIGDNEVKDFMEKCHASEKIEDFFKLLKDPKEIERRIKKYHLKESKELFTDLVKDIIRLSLFNEKVDTIGDDVKKANYGGYRDQDVSWYGEWSNSKQVNQYYGLREDITRKIKHINGLVGKILEAEENITSLDVHSIGIPVNINTEEYLKFVQELVPPIERKIKNLNAILREKQQIKT